MMAQVTISQLMLEHAARAVETARDEFRINLDFSEQSLSEVDRILTAMYFNRDRGLVARLLNKSQEQEIREQAKTWGGYVGEILRRKWGGRWHTTPLPGGEVRIYLKLSGSNRYPVDEVYKRLTEGPQRSGLHEAALANQMPVHHARPSSPAILVDNAAAGDMNDHTRDPEPRAVRAGPTFGTLRVGIIGFGRIGAEHAGWLSQAREAKAGDVFDITPARRAIAEARGLRAHADLDALLAEPGIEAVLIATPTAMHHEHARRALQAGKHVMIEKPMALDLAQAKDLMQAADRAARLLCVFHNRRWDPDYLTLKKAIAAGTLGEVINIESRIGQWSSCVGPAATEWRPGWRNEASFGGGGLYDWGSHFLDQLWRMMHPARPLRVFAQLRGNVWSRDCDDFARVCLDFDSGAAALMEINTTTVHPLPRWHVDGTAGSVQSPHSLEFDLDVWSRLMFSAADGAAPAVLPRAEPGLSERQIWDGFARAVRSGAAAPVPAASVLPTMALLDAARESARSGRAVDVSGVAWEL
jgi:predicted dehydrogenase